MFIIKRVVSMNGEGFRRVFEDYHKLVLHVAYDLLQDHERAQAVCEDVFVAFYEEMERVEEERIKDWMLENAQKMAAQADGRNMDEV